MPRRALAEHRPYLLLSLVAGVSYYFAADEAIGGLWLMLWKGLAVGFLGLYAAHRGRGVDGGLIAVVMAMAALGDMALEVSYVAAGVLFKLGHALALLLYARNRREHLSPSQIGLAAALVVFIPIIAAALTYPLPNWFLATTYALFLSVMVAAAWTSRFPRYRTGIGALLFAASHLLLIAREGGDLPADVTNPAIWPLYFAGQFLIVTGVVQTLRGRRG